MATRILIIDDTPENRELMAYLLEAAGYVTLAAEDGTEGLALARSELPDLILCDSRMPGIDGFEVARRAKSDPAIAHIPLISSTAAAMVGDRERILGAGFDGYVAKPIDPLRFAEQIAAFLPEAARAVRPSSE